jgi:hypothetical protein
MTVKVNDILVCEKTQRYACGALRLRKGAIVQVVGESTWSGPKIKRFKRAPEHTHFNISDDNMRLANKEEIARFEAGEKMIKDD